MAWLKIHVDYARAARAWDMIHRADLEPDIESFSRDTADFLTIAAPVIAYDRPRVCFQFVAPRKSPSLSEFSRLMKSGLITSAVY